MNRELKEKLERVRGFLERESYDGALFTTNANFSWISCGKSAFVDKSAEAAAAKIYITPKEAYVLCNSSEMFRIPHEELPDGDFDLVHYRWHDSEADVIKKLTGGGRAASDTGAFGTANRAGDLKRLRYILTEEEAARYRRIGLEAAKIVEECCRGIRPGETELHIAGRTAGMFLARGFRLPVCLVAADHRLLRYRHPIPTENAVKNCAMIAVCAQKYGLTASLSRIVSFGPLDDRQRAKYDALLKVDAAYILSTAEGAVTGNIVRKAHDCYREAGYEEDFHLHHQGGALGYETRDYCANEQCAETVGHRQAFSWNPTIAGVKLEDTLLVDGGTREIITQTGDWPLRSVEFMGQQVARPLILER